MPAELRASKEHDVRTPVHAYSATSGSNTEPTGCDGRLRVLTEAYLEIPVNNQVVYSGLGD